MNERPIVPGITYQGQTIPEQVVEARRLQVSNATTLKDLDEEYFCYTPALLYMFVRLRGIEPFRDFLESYGKDVRPFSIQFDRPVFQGLEIGDNPYWNHTLFLMEREHGIPYVQWMLQTAFSDSEVRPPVLSRVRHKNIHIADPLQLDKAAVLPSRPSMIEILVFCLETTHGNYFIKPGGNPVLDLPSLATAGTVFKDTAAFASAIWQGEADPYAAAERAVAGDCKSAVEELEERVRREHPLQIPSPVSLESLTEEHREEVLEALRQLGNR